MTSKRLAPFGTTVFARISGLASDHGAVDLGQGRPDFDGPDFVKEAAARAMREHPNQYAPMPGVPVLRRALADRFEAEHGVSIDPDAEVTITSGATEALAATCLGLFEPGDRVVVFEPFYDAYTAGLALAGAQPVFVSLGARPDGSFGFDPAALRAACRGARAIMLNTPHNPTGKVFLRDELAVIAAAAQDEGLVVVSDEVYDHLVFGGFEHVPIATLPGMRERTITVGSFGKTFTMTGWKIGWAIAPPPLTAGVRAAHQFLTFAVPTPLQFAAAEAIASDDGVYRGIAERFEAKRDMLASGLRGLGLTFADPGGGYFILADHAPWSERVGVSTDVELCEWLIERAGVATIPPSAFYSNRGGGQGLLRFGFCKRDETIASALDRLRAALG